LTLQDCGSSVLINFADGTTATAHLVIACDGIHSTIRSQFAVDQPSYSGRIAYRGVLPLSGTTIESNWPYPSLTVSWLAPNKHFLVFPISQNRLLNVVAFVTKPESELAGLKESWKSSAPRADLEKEYEGWTENVQKIILAMDPVVSKWKLNDRELLSQWCYMGGKVVLSGDAAHAMLPHQGMSSRHNTFNRRVVR
jgi:salicylate hydroxylase